MDTGETNQRIDVGEYLNELKKTIHVIGNWKNLPSNLLDSKCSTKEVKLWNWFFFSNRTFNCKVFCSEISGWKRLHDRISCNVIGSEHLPVSCFLLESNVIRQQKLHANDQIERVLVRQRNKPSQRGRIVHVHSKLLHIFEQFFSSSFVSV